MGPRPGVTVWAFPARCHLCGGVLSLIVVGCTWRRFLSVGTASPLSHGKRVLQATAQTPQDRESVDGQGLQRIGATS